MVTKKILIGALFMLVMISANAQENYAYVSWNYQAPLSNREWLNSSSGHGGMAGYRAFLRDEKFSVGVDFNWMTFDQYQPTETFQFDNGALTTDYYKYVYQYGAVVSGQYYLPAGESEIFFPYVGLGVGANYNRYLIYYNIYQDEYRGWGFLARPEAGVVVRFSPNRSIGAIAAVHYDYSTNKNQEFNYDNFTSAGFKIGIVVMGR